MFIPVKMRDQIQKWQDLYQLCNNINNCIGKAHSINLNEPIISSMQGTIKLLCDEFNKFEKSVTSAFHEFYDGTNVKVKGSDGCLVINSDCKMHIGPEGLVLDFFPEPERLVSADVKDVTVMD